MPIAFDQHGHLVRMEWGLDGVRTLAPACSVLVIVDVMSFSTAVDVAVGRGASVLPLEWPAAGGGMPAPAEALAPAETLPPGVVLARHRSLARWSLSPASLDTLPAGTRLALPSPNGAALSAAAARSGVAVLAGCLRNAATVAAVALSLARPHRPTRGQDGTRGMDGRGSVIGLVAAGERWPDGRLRPALEDLLGAGAVVASIMAGAPEYGARQCSPEALAAADAFEAARRRGLADELARCASGRELTGRGFAADVAMASEYGVSAAAPLLRDGEFRDAHDLRRWPADGGTAR